MYRSTAATRFQCTMKSKITQITIILFVMLKVSVSTSRKIIQEKKLVVYLTFGEFRSACGALITSCCAEYFFFCWFHCGFNALGQSKKLVDCVFCYKLGATHYTLKAKNIIKALNKEPERDMDLNTKLGRFLKLKLTVPLFQSTAFEYARQNWPMPSCPIFGSNTTHTRARALAVHFSCGMCECVRNKA